VGPDSEGQVHDVQPVTWETYKYRYDRTSEVAPGIRTGMISGVLL